MRTPPVYRPAARTNSVQATAKPGPVVPAPYRPTTAAAARPSPPPVYRPGATAAAQASVQRAQTRSVRVPPVYRPQQATSVQRKSTASPLVPPVYRPASVRPIVQAKLPANTYQTFRKDAGEPESSGVIKSTYQKLLVKLQDYMINLDSNKAATNDQRAKELVAINDLIVKWMGKHNKHKGSGLTDKQLVRRHAMKWLQARIAGELTKVQTIAVSKSGEVLKGGNTGAEVKTATFKKDIGITKQSKGIYKEVPESLPLPSAAFGSGIEQTAPNWIGRALASTVIATLFRSRVVAHVARTGPTSYAIDKAIGVPGQKDAWFETPYTPEDVPEDTTGYAHEKGKVYKTVPYASEIDWNERYAVKQLVELQLLDAVCGQQDRHAGNFYYDKGKTGGKSKITGIDPDVSFGKTATAVTTTNTVAHLPKALPPEVDIGTYMRFVSVSDHDLRDALDGLLSDEEIDAAVMRLGMIRTHLLNLQSNGHVLYKNQGFTLTSFTPQNSYVGREMPRQATDPTDLANAEKQIGKRFK